MSDAGVWEVWVERADQPGIKLERQTIAYEVRPAIASIGAAVLGIVLVVAVAAIAFISTLGTGPE